MKKLIKSFALTVIAFAVFSVSTEASAANESSIAGKVTTQKTALNIRSSASVNAKKLTSAKKGSYLTLMSKSGDWWKVEYQKGKYGYCHSDFITKVSASYAANAAISDGVLNVRSGRGTDYKIKDTLEKGTYVVVLKSYNDWSQILYSGNKTGYVSSKYLSKADTASTYKKISLSVPSYKQTDSRWANVKIGTQGDTLYSSGCTTTALAMTESYRLKKEITPKDMVSRLSYSESGMLYWPTNYNVSLADSGSYLSDIYAQLKKGKPVIFGMKKANGTQHWVVVTGYSKSSSSLSRANFTVNDPGSNTRTTLSQVMSVYPYVYKIATAK